VVRQLDGGLCCDEDVNFYRVDKPNLRQ